MLVANSIHFVTAKENILFIRHIRWVLLFHFWVSSVGRTR